MYLYPKLDLKDKVGPFVISTVFVGSYDDEWVFETIIFDKDEDYQVQTHTLKDAKAAHADAIVEAKTRFYLLN